MTERIDPAAARASAERSPSELARETLRLIATRKLAPTPENFSSIFHEIAGPGAAADTGDAATPGPALAAAVGAAQNMVPEVPAASVAGMPELCEQLARLLEFMQPALGEDDARMREDAQSLAAFCRERLPPATPAALRTRLANFNHRLAFVAEEQAGVRQSLLGMLRTVFENIGELSLDDRWMRHQAELLMTASQPPLSLRRLEDVERRLRDVIDKQAELKRQLVIAQDDTKRLLAQFIDKLSEIAEASGAQGLRIEECARRIQAARDLADVGPALSEAIALARGMSQHALEVHHELSTIRRRAAASESEVDRLRRELDAVSSASRHDALTGALNRKGLDETLGREVVRARRLSAALSVALLDIDDFKTINDQHGHLAGDAALTHLAGLARAALRPQDSLCRYGGEEFVILLPDTALDEGVQLLQHLQRELTRHFFMAGESRVLITFSAGVTTLAEGEAPLDAIERADKGMYLAKRSGKNKVVAA